MIHVAICDDMPDQLDIIERATKNYFHSIREVAGIERFSKAMDFLEALEKRGDFDLVLLDICMPGMMGTDIAAEMRKRNSHCEIIFISTSDEYGMEAFSVHAVNYLVKPFTQEDFNKAMKHVMEIIRQRHTQKIILRIVGGVRVVEINDILYVETDKHIQHVYLKDDSVLDMRQTFAEVVETLDKVAPGQFASPTKGYYVNQLQIVSIRDGFIEMQNKHMIPLSKRRSRDFQEAYFEYIFANI